MGILNFYHYKNYELGQTSHTGPFKKGTVSPKAYVHGTMWEVDFTCEFRSTVCRGWCPGWCWPSGDLAGRSRSSSCFLGWPGPSAGRSPPSGTFPWTRRQSPGFPSTWTTSCPASDVTEDGKTEERWLFWISFMEIWSKSCQRQGLAMLPLPHCRLPCRGRRWRCCSGRPWSRPVAASQSRPASCSSCWERRASHTAAAAPCAMW